MSKSICDAIRARAIVQFYHDGGLRTVEPYWHGTNGKGEEVLVGYQTSGYSRTEPLIGWKTFDVRRITGLRSTGAAFPRGRSPEASGHRALGSVCCGV